MSGSGIIRGKTGLQSDGRPDGRTRCKLSIWSEDKDGGNREGALQKGEIRGWEMNRSFVGGLIGIWKNAASERGIPGLPLLRWREGREGRGGDDGAAK